jgi:hypothetical protein
VILVTEGMSDRLEGGLLAFPLPTCLKYLFCTASCYRYLGWWLTTPPAAPAAVPVGHTAGEGRLLHRLGAPKTSPRFGGSRSIHFRHLLVYIVLSDPTRCPQRKHAIPLTILVRVPNRLRGTRSRLR